MTPTRRDLRHRNKDESAPAHSGVRKFGRSGFHASMIIEKIKIEGSWCIGNIAATAEFRLDVMQP